MGRVFFSLLFCFFFFFKCLHLQTLSRKSFCSLKTCSYINFLTSIWFLSHFHLLHKPSLSTLLLSLTQTYRFVFCVAEWLTSLALETVTATSYLVSTFYQILRNRTLQPFSFLLALLTYSVINMCAYLWL